jgi:hypothetical protein
MLIKFFLCLVWSGSGKNSTQFPLRGRFVQAPLISNVRGYKLAMHLQAAYFRDGLQLGLCEVPDVVRWADYEIACLEDPPYELIELSLLGGDIYEAIRKLRNFSEGISVTETLPLLLSAAHNRLQTEVGFGPPLAEALYQIYIQQSSVLPEYFSICGYFDDAYSLAISRTFGIEEDVYQELLEFTAEFASTSNNIFNPTASQSRRVKLDARLGASMEQLQTLV